MAMLRANCGEFGEIGASHFEAAYCLDCASSFDALDSLYDCSGCDSPIVEGEQIVTLTLHTGTLVYDDLKFIEASLIEVYRVHWDCFRTENFPSWLNHGQEEK